MKPVAIGYGLIIRIAEKVEKLEFSRGFDILLEKRFSPGTAG